MKWTYLDIRQITPEDFERWYAMADGQRQKKADRYRFPDDRLRSIAGDHLARMGLAEYCGIDPASVRFARTEKGKPYASGLDAHFSISHSGHLVVCALSDRPVGIDVERIRPIKEELAKRVCTAPELFWMQSAPGWGQTLTGEAMIRFFRIWTSKEAWFKMTGTGITDLQSFDTLEHIRNGGTFELEGHMVSIYE